MSHDTKASRAICDAATAGPWLSKEEEVVRADGRYRVAACGYCVSSDAGPETDAAFIAHARTALPAALDEIDRLRAETLPIAVDAFLKAHDARVKLEATKAPYAEIKGTIDAAEAALVVENKLIEALRAASGGVAIENVLVDSKTVSLSTK